ncbi:hypothetical protein D3C87_283640 [compost metagenome]
MTAQRSVVAGPSNDILSVNAHGCRSFPCRYRGGGGSRQSAGARPYQGVGLSGVPSGRAPVRSRRCVPPQWEHRLGGGDASRCNGNIRPVAAMRPAAGTLVGSRPSRLPMTAQRSVVAGPSNDILSVNAHGCRSFPCRYRGGGGSRQSAGARPYQGVGLSGVPSGRAPVRSRRCVPPQWEHPSGRGAASRAGTGSVAAIRPAAMGPPSDRGDASRRNRARSAPTKKPAVRRVFSRRAGTGRPYGIGWLTPSRTVRTGAGSGRRSHRPPGW